MLSLHLLSKEATMQLVKDIGTATVLVIVILTIYGGYIAHIH